MKSLSDMGGQYLSVRDEQILESFPSDYRERAMRAIQNGKAFCPSCHWAGHCNCAHFDECNAFIEPKQF